ncbi:MULTISPECIES: helix-turn-helix transcriptional regulator [unclassified Rhodococcus (in: high G+C Gram-positive bacteria)]|uniref:helix-turn-helix transcriptional regulator n=1 Tax=unclassified Rhodococcus (in: high G+C Gram-positive bacteria) TaxID=192944 RepID=UPI0027DC4511|nr:MULTISPECIES: helix-turn-helix transcriptional regulator [unclassified Rhodococcus (in: high G+C Gram-positive bacteria)]
MTAPQPVTRIRSSLVRRPLLSAREVEVLLTWLSSDSKSRAAQELFVSESTLDTHITRIRSKYASVGRSAPTKAALFARALQDGLTTLDEW